MLRQKTLGTYAAAIALVIGAGAAYAQGDPGAATDPATGAAGTDASAGLTQQVKLSPQEQLAQAEATLSRMSSARSTVRRQLAEARAERDVVKTLCLDDKLSQLDVALRSATERKEALELAVGRNDADLSNHEFTIISVLRQRADQLSAEANQCIGNEAGFVGDSSVESSIDPGLPEEDPSEYPNFDVIVETPACSSCFD
jgi:hypothetical protein